MASFLFKNTKTSETKVINSKDAATAKRVYSNKTWEYVKAVPQQKSAKVTKSEALPKKAVVWMKVMELHNMLHDMAEEADDYGYKSLRNKCYEADNIIDSLRDLLK